MIPFFLLTPLAQAVASLISAKPTYVVVGESHHLPYADELGL